jgi:hypothetical protein
LLTLDRSVTDHGPQRVRVTDRDLHVLVRQHGLGDEERQER